MFWVNQKKIIGFLIAILFNPKGCIVKKNYRIKLQNSTPFIFVKMAILKTYFETNHTKEFIQK